MRETPLTRPSKDWALEKAKEYEALAERPDLDGDARAVFLEEAAKLKRWAEDLL